MDKFATTSDVVIVGAGMAGLTAARALSLQGVQVIVVEARDRVGGRMHSLEREGGAVDLGATWFWPNEPLVHSLLKEHDLLAYPQPEDGDALYLQRGGIVQRLPSNLFASGAFRFSGGAQSLPLAMAAALPAGSLHLNTPVTRIVTEGDTVLVETATGTFSARDVIVAVPPPLALESIVFDPTLPTSFEEIARQTMVWMGGMIKAVAIYSRPFWREQELSGTILSEVGPFREVHDHSAADGRAAALFGFAPASAMQDRDQTSMVDLLLEQLVSCFGPEAAVPQDVVMTNWAAERYTSPRHQHADAAPATYGHPVFQADRRILWASTETADAFSGHIEGAIRAGIRAAIAVRRAAD